MPNLLKLLFLLPSLALSDTLEVGAWVPSPSHEVEIVMLFQNAGKVGGLYEIVAPPADVAWSPVSTYKKASIEVDVPALSFVGALEDSDNIGTPGILLWHRDLGQVASYQTTSTWVEGAPVGWLYFDPDGSGWAYSAEQAAWIWSSLSIAVPKETPGNYPTAIADSHTDRHTWLYSPALLSPNGVSSGFFYTGESHRVDTFHRWFYSAAAMDWHIYGRDDQP